ncbi:hypothetical protein STEG23_012065 [Scotinomys teguina]
MSGQFWVSGSRVDGKPSELPCLKAAMLILDAKVFMYCPQTVCLQSIHHGPSDGVCGFLSSVKWKKSGTVVKDGTERINMLSSWGRNSFQKRFVDFKTDNPPRPLGLSLGNLAKKVGNPSEELS